jgi:hypothetical protein
MPVLRDCQSEIIDDFDGLVARGSSTSRPTLQPRNPVLESRRPSSATPKCSTRKNFIGSPNLPPHVGDNGQAR